MYARHRLFSSFTLCLLATVWSKIKMDDKCMTYQSFCSVVLFSTDEQEFWRLFTWLSSIAWSSSSSGKPMSWLQYFSHSVNLSNQHKYYQIWTSNFVFQNTGLLLVSVGEFKRKLSWKEHFIASSLHCFSNEIRINSFSFNPSFESVVLGANILHWEYCLGSISPKTSVCCIRCFDRSIIGDYRLPLLLSEIETNAPFNVESTTSGWLWIHSIT